MKNLYEETLAWLRKKAEEEGGKTTLAKKINATRATFHKVIQGKETYASTYLSWLQKLGASIKFPEEGSIDTTRKVQFVEPKALSANYTARRSPSEDYFAVPLVQIETAANRWWVPDDLIRGWVLIWRHHKSIGFRSNLVAVEIGKGEDSMIPTLHAEDLVAVDRDDFKNDFAPPGNIFLVRHPDGDIAIKRVSVVYRDNDSELIYYSDNTMKYPPSPAYSLWKHFNGDISRAIVGRVVWGWSNMTRK